jgi:D-3-phosphoglycerate dehydrogenase / 2-oxoglutarate reductase
MTLQPSKQQIIIENIFEDYTIEKDLLQSTSYELVLIKNSEDDLLARLSPTTVAIINIFIPITAQLVSQLPSSIKVITVLGAGYDKIDVNMCRRRGIAVCYVPDYATNTVADHAVALLFAAQRRLLIFHNSIVEKHQWNKKVAGKLQELNTMTLGIIGCGRIGTCFADKMRPFVKQILTYNSKNSTTNTLKEIFEECDIISLHIPISTMNHHLISSDSIAQMKRRPILINVSRGGLIDTKALVQALKSGQISYAALDVVEGEPSIDEELVKLDNVLLTPHVAWYTEESKQALRTKAIEDILRVLRGEQPIYPVPE